MSPGIAGVFPVAIVAVFLFVLLGRTWGRGRLAGRDRYALISTTVDASVAATLARVLVMPQGAASWGWVVACGLIGLGIAGAVLRWSSLAWDAPAPGKDRPPRPRRRMAQSAVYVVVGAAIVAVLV